MCKISEKNSKPYFSGSSWKFLFYKQKALILVKDNSLSKITNHYFSVRNLYNEAIAKFVLKIKYSRHSHT